jgi:hypothetical protein
MIELTDDVFTAALESAYKSGLEAGIESERSRIARIISDTAYDASSGLTPGLLSKAIMVVAKRVFGEVYV